MSEWISNMQKVANLARFLIDGGEGWVAAYELDNGVRTGRWKAVNESAETDEFFPDFWLPEPPNTQREPEE